MCYVDDRFFTFFVLGTYYKLNADQYVLARVKYSEAMTAALENPVREMKLPPVDRTAILDDAFVEEKFTKFLGERRDAREKLCI